MGSAGHHVELKPGPAGAVVFAGGGSGGHISPALAVAERLAEIDPAVPALFLCSPRAIDRTMLREAGVRFEVVPAAPLGIAPRILARFAAGYLRARRAAAELLRVSRARRVVALGGFVAAPVAAAAQGAGVPVMLLNLDAVPGRAGRWIARRAADVLSAVETPGQPEFARRVVGLPVRCAALADGDPSACRRRLGLDAAAPTLLVTGASQGSRSLNELLIALARGHPGVPADWQVLHLAGEGDDAAVRAAYAAAGVRAAVEPFVHRMGDAWGAADLAVSRAGASSVAEARANAVPTVFLPYPHHRDRHQHRNAEPMARAGGAVIEDDLLDPRANLRRAGAVIVALLNDGARRAAMRDALLRRRPPDAAETVARLLVGRGGDEPAAATPAVRPVRR